MKVGENVKLPRVASLHEKAVQKIATGEVTPMVPRRSGPRGPKSVIAVKDLVVDRLLWDYIKSNEIDCRCVQIISETEVIVWNSPEQAAQKRKEARLRVA